MKRAAGDLLGGETDHGVIGGNTRVGELRLYNVALVFWQRT